jgi:hypothetical protein
MNSDAHQCDPLFSIPSLINTPSLPIYIAGMNYRDYVRRIGFPVKTAGVYNKFPSPKKVDSVYVSTPKKACCSTNIPSTPQKLMASPAPVPSYIGIGGLLSSPEKQFINNITYTPSQDCLFYPEPCLPEEFTPKNLIPTPLYDIANFNIPKASNAPVTPNMETTGQNVSVETPKRPRGSRRLSPFAPSPKLQGSGSSKENSPPSTPKRPKRNRIDSDDEEEIEVFSKKKKIVIEEDDEGEYGGGPQQEVAILIYFCYI